MKTRPVFESYSDFVQALYEMEDHIPGFIDGLDSAINETKVFPRELIRGNSVKLPGLLTSINSKTTKYNGSGSSALLATEWMEFLQICASSQPSIANKLNSIGNYISALLTKDYINSDTCRIYEKASFFRIEEVVYRYGDNDVVEVKGAPNAQCNAVVKYSQFISCYELCGRIAAYNASIQQNAFETMMKSMDKQGEFKRAIKGKFRSNWFMKIFGSENIEGFEQSAGMGKCLYIAESAEKGGGVGSLKVSAVENAPSSDFSQYHRKKKNMVIGGQFKFPFPVLVGITKGTGQLLSSTTRTKLVLPDKTKKTENFDGVISVTPPSDKINFYVPNKADMTDQGKEAITGIINQFLKIDKLIVMGSADNRKPTGWDNNTKLAEARRDETIKYLEELVALPGTSLTGAKIEKGGITVQPSGETEGYDKWRSVRIQPSGEIYSDINDALKDDSETKAKPVTYTEKKKGDVIKFQNLIFTMSFDSGDLNTPKERRSALGDKSEVQGKEKSDNQEPGEPTPD
jgi:hypothetical protein